MTKTVRTRFAPSPTGPLHIGSARTALFSWLLARHHNGQFVLRVEDTDQKRYVPGSLELVMEGLSWLGLDWDEGPDKGGDYGPYTQSQRLEHYQKWANWLVENGYAYRAYDTSEELAQINEERKAKKLQPGYDGRHRELTTEQEAQFISEGRKPVIRFKAPGTGKTVVQDLIRGQVEFDNDGIQDMVLLKSDGFPTYHLAHVVDDYLMEISHITRSIEWLPSFPLHYHLWQAFGWEMPQYAHLPVLLNPNGKGKLSKRHAGFSEDGKRILVLTKEFQDAGYYAPAVVNFLTNIGWNFGDEREIFDVEESIARFDITTVNPANSVYPIEKLDWINGIYIREKMSTDELAQQLHPVLENAGFAVDMDVLLKVVPIIQTRLKTLNDVVEMAGFFFRDTFIPAEKAVLIQNKMDEENTIKVLKSAKARYAEVEDFTTDTLHAVGAQIVEELGLKNGQVFGTLRAAVTGQKVSPPTFESMEIIGKDESLRRIALSIEILQ